MGETARTMRSHEGLKNVPRQFGLPNGPDGAGASMGFGAGVGNLSHQSQRISTAAREGDRFGAYRMDCSGCPEEIECEHDERETPVSATPWELDAQGDMCYRWATCLDHCSEFNPGNAEVICSQADHGGVFGVIRWGEMKYSDGRCWWSGMCADGKHAVQDTSGSDPVEDSRTLVYPCSPTKVPLSLQPRVNPHWDASVSTSGSDCCDSWPNLDGTKPSPAPLPSTFTAKALSGLTGHGPYSSCVGTDIADGLSVIKATLEYAYGLYLANADVIARNACIELKATSLTNCACKLLAGGTAEVLFVSYPTGTCPTKFEPAAQIDYARFTGSTSITSVDADSWTNGGTLSTEFYCGILTNGLESKLYLAAKQGPSTTAAMLDLVALIAHEVTHTSCNYSHAKSGDHLELDAYQRAVSRALKTRYGV